MKKLMSVLLAAVMAVGMSTMAFAATSEVSGKTAAATPTTFTFEKVYTDPAGNDVAVFPKETLEFEVEADAENPDDTLISVKDTTVSSNPADITIDVPAYSNVGLWEYTVSEVQGATQGVGYSQESFGVEVYVFWDDDNTMKKQVTFTTGEAGSKIDKITNTYSVSKGDPDPDPDPNPEDKTHGLYVTKNIEGNMASRDKKFDIYVTFTSDKPVLSDITGTVTVATGDWEQGEDGTYSVTKTVSLAGGETAYFDYIPEGVKYSVEEDAAYQEPDDAHMADPEKGYSVTYVGETGTVANASSNAASVTNEKSKGINTGVILETAPYVLIAVLAAAGVALVMKKRYEI